MQPRPEGGRSNAMSTVSSRCFQALRPSKPSGEESLKAEDARPGVHRCIQICLEKCSSTRVFLTAQQGTNGQQKLVFSELSPQPDSAPNRQALHLMACFNGSREQKQGWEVILGADQWGMLWAHTFAAEGASDTGGGRCPAFFKLFILGLILPAGSTSNTHTSSACHWQAVRQRVAMETGKCKIIT